jgi:hypothetical protein
MGLSEAQVVVCRDVKSSRLVPSETERGIEVVAGPIKTKHCPATNACDRAGEAVIETGLQTPRVEGVEVRVESRVALCLDKMTVSSREDALAHVVSQMTDDDQNEVGDVSSQDDPIGRLFLVGIRKRRSRRVL